ERMLRPGGVLAVVTFHSLEDRVVKRFFARRSGGGGRANRWAPDAAGDAPRFDKVAKPRRADIAEVEANPRARSATLRMGRRTDTPSGPADFARLGLPRLSLAGGAS
ncbi:MAG: 16S rRNA (cytosine(1402)-N(4))-methyltransferase, partial [Pseudomonadota bacterium]